MPKDDTVDPLPGVDVSAETANLDGDECLSFLTRCFSLRFHQPAGLSLSVAAPSLPSRSPACRMILARVRSFSCLSSDWMSLLSHSRDSRTVSEPCRSFLTWCFRLRCNQPAGLSLSVAAPSLPSSSLARRMILACVRSFSCLPHVYRTIGCHCSCLHEPAGRFQSLVAHRPF